MVLVVDIGNTDTKFGIFVDDELKARWAIHSDLNRNADEHAVLLKAMLAHVGGYDIEVAIVGSVVPVLTGPVAAAVEDATGCHPRIPEADQVPSIQLEVDVPKQVGIDRVANALAAREIYQAPAIVADLGSVTTFDVVNASGNLAGVVIALGMQASAQALTAAGAQLPSVNLGRPAQLIGTNTKASMKSGIFWGYVHMVRGMLEELRHDLGSDYTTIATGGQAPLVVGDVGMFDIIDTDLTLRGLLLIEKAFGRSI